jgi:hypothetical protein
MAQARLIILRREPGTEPGSEKVTWIDYPELTEAVHTVELMWQSLRDSGYRPFGNDFLYRGIGHTFESTEMHLVHPDTGKDYQWVRAVPTAVMLASMRMGRRS